MEQAPAAQPLERVSQPSPVGEFNMFGSLQPSLPSIGTEDLVTVAQELNLKPTQNRSQDLVLLPDFKLPPVDHVLPSRPSQMPIRCDGVPELQAVLS